jgi:hypothetical protein
MIDGFDQREIPRRFDLTSRTGPPCSRPKGVVSREPIEGDDNGAAYSARKKDPPRRELRRHGPRRGLHPSAIRRGPINSNPRSRADDSADGFAKDSRPLDENRETPLAVPPSMARGRLIRKDKRHARTYWPRQTSAPASVPTA